MNDKSTIRGRTQVNPPLTRHTNAPDPPIHEPEPRDPRIQLSQTRLNKPPTQSDQQTGNKRTNSKHKTRTNQNNLEHDAKSTEAFKSRLHPKSVKQPPEHDITRHNPGEPPNQNNNYITGTSHEPKLDAPELR